MFRMYGYGDVGGDCTMRYGIELDKEYTVKEFIDTILKEKSNEWGGIEIMTGNNSFSEVSYRYNYGKLSGCIDEKYSGKKIVGAAASGGWSKMDYIIRV